jgi:DNA-binding NarL/FixJ family response regulator
MPARVLLADDHLAVATRLSAVLETEFTVVGVVHDGAALLEAAATLSPDVIVADISMPRVDGFTALKRLTQERPRVCVILLTNYADPDLAAAALAAGATGFVLKSHASVDLVPAVRTSLAGGTFVSARLREPPPE